MSEFRRGEVRANGLRFATLEAGDGPLVLCLHGFPDHARSFRHQLPALAQAGFRAVAPFMRGYAPSDVPADGPYQSAALAEDAAALLAALDDQPAALFGHDWGAVAAYGAAILAPQRVARLITAAVPHGPALPTAFMTNYEQQRRSWYMFFFQTPLADLALAHDDFRFLERLWRDWSPGWSWPAEEMEALKATFRQPGVAGAALAYYRQTLNPLLQRPELAATQERVQMSPVTVPTLYLHGADDGCIGRQLADGMEAFFPAGLEKRVVPGAGHFVHQERPDIVNPALLDFLAPLAR
ncbi:MAG: alpha/beta hydrolase [Deltaproteobacteria bacterium]|nr:alpha/beta hydrolase [Deltaproteobacteria bacterium]